jgi:hypothetical protein
MGCELCGHVYAQRHRINPGYWGGTYADDNNLAPPGMTLPSGLASVPCTGCGATLLLSPSSQALVAAGRGRPACPACAAAETAGRMVLPVMTAEGRQELRAYERDDAARN